jgi:hypothetical protein
MHGLVFKILTESLIFEGVQEDIPKENMGQR